MLRSEQEIQNARENTGFSNITTSGGNQLIKSGAGFLHAVALNLAPTSALRLFDGITSAGDTLATIPAAAAAGTFYQYDVALETGLVLSSGHVGSMDVTLIFR